MWYEDFNYDNIAFDDASPLAIEMQAAPWPPSYKPPQLPMYDGYSDPKQFLMSYEATISSYGGNTSIMAKSLVMAVMSVFSDLVLFSQARHNCILAEVEGYVDHKFPEVSDEASNCSSFVPMHIRP
jgi:hypothetical protein